MAEEVVAKVPAEDMAAAKKVYELAQEKGIGLEVSITP